MASQYSDASVVAEKATTFRRTGGGAYQRQELRVLRCFRQSDSAEQIRRISVTEYTGRQLPLVAGDRKCLEAENSSQCEQLNITMRVPIQASSQQGEICLHVWSLFAHRVAAFNESEPGAAQTLNLMRHAIAPIPVFFPCSRLYLDHAATADVDGRHKKRLAKCVAHHTLIAPLQSVHVRSPPNSPKYAVTTLDPPVLPEKATVLHSMNARIV